MKKILHVHSPGGAPLEHAFPRLAGCGELHVLAVGPLPDHTRDAWLPHCAGLTDRGAELLRGEALVEAITAEARRIGADAVTFLSEFLVLAVAEATRRLGLPGPGANAIRARDKRLMREVWRDAGVPVPSFRRIDRPADLADAFDRLTPPMLLKPAFGAGSVGHAVLRDAADLASAHDTVVRTVGQSLDRYGFGEIGLPDAVERVLVEEIVEGSTDGWYDDSGYGDYLSVEGIVADGVYHPVCITSRIPTVPPFTELSNNAPCVLPEPLQRRIEDVAHRAVDALGLDTCGTHTEIKLAADGAMFVIESAARFGGCMVTREIEAVFGIDPIALLTRCLLGERPALPPRMLLADDGERAAASLALVPITPDGVPWTSSPVWDASAADVSRLVSPGSTIEIVRGLSVPDGTRIPPYDFANGADNWAGIFFLTAKDAPTLLTDCYAVLNGLEGLLMNVRPSIARA
ncbi:ATP-grasp domain-containing protein [Actinomadura rupiterrae]|uniref:ATP-grasp domain-containing protein n=1 Tax=Actinomadura rupiterrae TaxID=559627 RepID=UPI0020A3A98C|nr:ATP-grasp domain-containing protein [Actinomadura rupiterrae]MCP2336340.1 biotin carboxylase [Actinomadura rupiterrae]